MSLEYRSNKWFIIFWPWGRYGKRIREPVPPIIQTEEEARKYHDAFILEWKTVRFAKYNRKAEASRIWRRKKKTDPTFILNRQIRAVITQSLKDNTKNLGKWETLVGYTADQLRNHIERHFRPGMSWKNYGEWHLDHVIPVSAFNYKMEKDIDFRRCWALDNLRPTWKTQNLSKGKHLEKPFQPSLCITL